MYVVSNSKTIGTSEKVDTFKAMPLLPDGHIIIASCWECLTVQDLVTMPMRTQTYKNGHRYYREHHQSRSLAVSPTHGGSIPCELADNQVTRLVEAIELGPRWLEDVLAIISLTDEVERVRKELQTAQEKLRRMAKAYVDGLIPDEEYRQQKRLLKTELKSLVVPQANAAEEAGNLIQNLPRLWTGANLDERPKTSFDPYHTTLETS